MSRRDTIIVAVLVNAGLLIVLFASALKSEAPKDEFAISPVSIPHEVPDLSVKKEVALEPRDEVDLALTQFAKNSIATQPFVQPSEPITMPNFADDLRAIATVETTSAQPVQAPAAQTLVAPIAPKLKPAAEFTEIKVKKGDVLEKIARQHHTTVAEIMKVNKLANSSLRIGQVLKIPNKAIRKAEPSTIVYSPQNNEGAKYYTVKKGDNPWTIAVKNHLKVEDLLKLNNMTEDQSRRLKPGDQLRIQ
jgi:peptidoglycan endopeptidase LytF